MCYNKYETFVFQADKKKYKTLLLKKIVTLLCKK